MGGTFDPIHYGHLRLAEEMAETIGLERVLFIPAGQPPHRDPPRTAAPHRLEMTRLAVGDNARFVVDAREIERARPSYTVDTLTELRAELGTAQPLWLLIGTDAFLGLPGWHEWERLFELANIAVAGRPGIHSPEVRDLPAALRDAVSNRLAADASDTGPSGSVLLHATTPLDISATAIRAMLGASRSARYLLPPAVLAYIHEHELYGNP